MSEDGLSQVNEPLTRLILQYLIEHPDAKDTSEGIHKWWLPQGYSKGGRNEVQSVLDSLTAKGWLTKRGRIRSKEIYDMSKDRNQEIRTFLLSRASFYE